MGDYAVLRGKTRGLARAALVLVGTTGGGWLVDKKGASVQHELWIVVVLGAWLVVVWVQFGLITWGQLPRSAPLVGLSVGQVLPSCWVGLP